MEPQIAVEAIRPSDLPAPPEAALQIMYACSREEVNNQELTEIAARDPVLTAELLRVVNSPFFGLSNEVQSIARAIAVLGHRALRNIALCISVRDALRTDDIPDFDVSSYWEDTLRRASAARLLGKAIRLSDDECFTAGMLQDFGLLVMIYLQPQHAGKWPVLRTLDPEARRTQEKEIFSITHDQVVLLLAHAWSLPSALGEALGYHHGCEAVQEKNTAKLCRVMELADWIAAVYNSLDKTRVMEQCRQRAESLFSLSQEQVDKILTELPQQVQLSAQAMGLEVPEQQDFEQILRDTNVRLAEANLSYQDLNWRLEKAIRERDELAEALNRELEIASEIQKSLLPREGGEDFPVSGINLSARELSGDFFDFFELPDGRIYFSLGDVSGKGITAALLMAKTCSLFRCLGKQDPTPAQLISIINNEICETSVRGMFVTMIIGLYSPACGSLTLVNAGSPPALLFQNDGSVRRLESVGPPVGIVANAEFPEVELNMRGGRLYLYSDGLTEGFVREREMLGIDGLESLLLSHLEKPPRERLREVLGDLKHATDNQRDDITLLLVEDPVAGFAPVLEYRFVALARELQPMRCEVIKALQNCGCSVDMGKRMILAVNEACMNIIQHAYEKEKPGEIVVEILNNGRELMFRITDYAKPIDRKCVKSRDLDDLRPGGLGVHLIHEVMDHVRFVDYCGKAGNILEMRKAIE